MHATVQRYNQQGPQALSDRRHTNPGRQPKLRPEETTQVLQALQSPPPDGGLWTGEKLRRWVVLRLGKRLSLNPIYRPLHTAGFRLKVPRPVGGTRRRRRPIKMPKGRGGEGGGTDGSGLCL